MQEPSGLIASPELVNSVTPPSGGDHCEWRITATHGERIVLNVTQLDIYESDNCETDFVEVRDGYWHKSPLLGRYCGTGHIPEMLLSTGYRMLIVYRTSTNQNGHVGFRAYYEGSQDCEYDKVDILSKMDNNTIRKHGLFCGSYLPPIITSEGNSLRIEFSSDNSVQKSGFAAGFLMDKDECAHNNGGCQHICKNTVGSYMCTCQNGFVLHPNEHDCKEGTCTHQISAPLGEINSPNYPDAYPSRKDCAWLFTTTPGHRLKLIFNDFELEPHQECAYDHISLYDSDSTDAPTLGRFCGAKVPHPILSTTNRMYMVFKSDASVQRKGFKASHSTACEGRLLATGRTVEHLYSHAKYGDQNYENREDCDWLVEAESGHVRLRFLTFELEHEQDCGYDFVQLFDGYDDSAPQLGKFCGNKMPGEFTSSSGSLLLRFRSDDNINAKGFSAAYSAVDTVEFGQQHAPAAPPFPAGASGSFSEVRAPHRRERRLRLHRH
nr:tolloid-like protein 1 [Rhipicephalus microplus]